MTQTETSNLNFKGLKIDPELLSVVEKFFTTPTPIQAQVIPVALSGKDVVGIAQTGTGKTLAFGIPMLQKLSRINGRGLVLVPTRELAQQVAESIGRLNKEYKKFLISVLIGGASSHDQIRELKRSPKIVVATPGRLVDHITRGNISLDDFKIVVLDEADRMFDIGFMPQIKRILKDCPAERETFLFSATMPEEIAKIASVHMKLPINIEVAPSGTTAEKIVQEVFIIERENKFRLLEKLLQDNAEKDDTILIFVRTKHSARKLTIQVRDLGVTAAELHSNRSLFQRKEALQGFKSGKYRVLICTDIASRGIDVKDISIVLNYDLPDNTEDYVHRIGRTGRAGKTGRAITFATHREKSDLRYIERLIRKQLSVLVLPELPDARPERKDLFIPENGRDSRNNNRRDRKRNERPNRDFSRSVEEVDGKVVIKPKDRGGFNRERNRDFSENRKFQESSASSKKDFSFDQFLETELTDYSKKQVKSSDSNREKKDYNDRPKKDFSSRDDRKPYRRDEKDNSKDRPSYEKRSGGRNFDKPRPSQNRFRSDRGGFSRSGQKGSFGGEKRRFFRGGESGERPAFEKKEDRSFGSSNPRQNRFSGGKSSFSRSGQKGSFGGEKRKFFRGGESGEKSSFEKKDGRSANKFSQKPNPFRSQQRSSNQGSKTRNFNRNYKKS